MIERWCCSLCRRQATSWAAPVSAAGGHMPLTVTSPRDTAHAAPPWEPQPWLLREMLHTPKGDKDSLLSVRKLFQSHTLSKPRFSPALLWAVVCGGNASCTETFL